VASLRFNYDGERRPEHKRPFNGNELYYMPSQLRTKRPIRYSGIYPIPPEDGEAGLKKKTLPQATSNQPVEIVHRDIPCTETSVIESEPVNLPEAQEEAESKEFAGVKLRLNEILAEKATQDKSGQKTGSEPADENQSKGKAAISAREKFIAGLESYESGIVRLNQQINASKVLFDEILFYIDSFLKILEVIKESELRKQQVPQVKTAFSKTKKDTVDEILELLQIPALQSILRQVLMGIMLKNNSQEVEE